jgi:hypothetical protein
MPNSEPVSPAADFRGPARRVSGLGARARAGGGAFPRRTPRPRGACGVARPPRSAALPQPLSCAVPRARAAPRAAPGAPARNRVRRNAQHIKPYTRTLTYHMTAIGIDVDRANAIERCYWRSVEGG